MALGGLQRARVTIPCSLTAQTRHATLSLALTNRPEFDMATSRDDLEMQLAALSAQMPALVREHPDDADFYPAFAGEADAILDGAGPADYEWGLGEVDKMLAANGKLRSDESPSDDLPPSS